MGMEDFISGKCAAVKDPKKFVDDWLATDKNPCSVCNGDRSKCQYYNELVEKGAISEEENTP